MADARLRKVCPRCGSVSVKKRTLFTFPDKYFCVRCKSAFAAPKVENRAGTRGEVQPIDS